MENEMETTMIRDGAGVEEGLVFRGYKLYRAWGLDFRVSRDMAKCMGGSCFTLLVFPCLKPLVAWTMRTQGISQRHGDLAVKQPQ